MLKFAGNEWLGGISYYRNLFSALQDLPNRRIDPVLITSGHDQAELQSRFPACTILHLPLLDAGRVLGKARQLARTAFGRDFPLERVLAAQKIAVLSHSAYLGRRASVASIVWIPDFQELTFPEFFSQRVLASRRRNAARSCRFASTVLLSSETALTDLRRIANNAVSTAVLPFVASVPPPSDILPRDEILKKYGLPDRFFHLPNQFWFHKNHIVVLRALAILKKEGRAFPIVATGNTSDPRQPHHFQSLMAAARDLDVDDLFVPLGVLPYHDMMSMMSHAVAVINPSKFEGWSTTVEEAKSMGKAVILSDIAVHREQAPDRGLFFSADDPEALGQRLSQAWDSWDSDYDLKCIDRAAAQLKLRRDAFARRYEDIVLATLERHAAYRGTQRVSIPE